MIKKNHLFFFFSYLEILSEEEIVTHKRILITAAPNTRQLGIWALNMICDVVKFHFPFHPCEDPRFSSPYTCFMSLPFSQKVCGK